MPSLVNALLNEFFGRILSAGAPELLLLYIYVYGNHGDFVHSDVDDS